MIIKALVRKGFIMRYSKEEVWEETLELIPPGDALPDRDAIPYYVDWTIEGEGPLQEYYGHVAPIDGPNVYRVVCLEEELSD